MSIRIALVGAKGRMGQTIIKTAASTEGVEIASALDLGDNLAEGIKQADVIIDFSSPAITAEIARHAIDYQKPLVIGTTGHREEEKRALVQQITRFIPLVWAGNYSVGVNLLYSLTRRAAGILNEDYDVEIIEMHHRLKKDAPSGTASRLLEILMEERKLNENMLRYGRQGLIGERPRGEIGVHSLRGGDVVGDHTVLFAAPGERIELTHKASDRSIFARGAIRAARWLLTEKPMPALYDMQDVLGLK